MVKIYMAPMEGVTTYVYRNIYDKYFGGVDRYFTPFVASSKLKGREKSEVSRETNKCENLIPQVLTNNINTFGLIVNQLKNMGYNEVNINLGCPSKTVTVKGRGAGMLADIYNLEKFLDEVFEKTDLKISIKTRLGISSMNEWEDILKVYQKFPLSELIVHARLLDELYGGSAHIDAFKLAQDMIDVPLCFNGDVRDVEGFERVVDECGGNALDVEGLDTNSVVDKLDCSECRNSKFDAVMLGRGFIGNPWLAEEIKGKILNYRDLLDNKFREVDKFDDCENQNNSTDSCELMMPKRLKTFKDFHDDLLAEYIKVMPGETPVLFKMKELWAYWLFEGDMIPKILTGISNIYQDDLKKVIKDVRKADSVAKYRSVVGMLF